MMKFKLNMSLRTRLVASVLLVSVPVLLITLLSFGSILSAQVENGTRQNLAATANAVAGGVDRWDHYFVLALENVRGQPDIVNMNPQDQMPVLTQMKKTYQRLEIVRITSPDGISTVRTDGDTPVNYADRQWFKACMAGQPVARQVLITKTTGKPALNVSTPILDVKGKVIGVLSAVTGIASMPEMLDLPGDSAVQTMVVDDQGMALAGGGVNSSALTNLKLYFPVERTLQGNFGAFTYSDVSGEQWLAHSVRASNGWYVISQISQKKVAAASSNLSRSSYALGGAAVLVLSGLAWLMAGMIVQPIAELTRGANELAAGNWLSRVPQRGNDEIGRLALSFNTMAEQLQNTYQKIEDKVSERTAELRRSEARVKMIIDGAPDAVVKCDSEGRIVTWNPQAAAYFGWTESEVVDRPLFATLFSAWQGDSPRQEVLGQLVEGEPEFTGRVELQAIDKNGREFPAEVSIALIGKDGKAHCAFIRDISDRKKAEAERDRLTAQLVDASRSAGMAEMATGVLHNVGNVLNSVNVTTSVLTKRMSSPEVAELAQATELFRVHKSDLTAYLTKDESGKHVPEYVAALAQVVSSQHQEMADEIRQLTKGVDHIKQIVRSQQQLAKSGVGLQEIDAAEFFQEAVAMNFASEDHDGIQIVNEIGIKGKIHVDKHRILQILVNLIANARQALNSAKSPDRRITLRIHADESLQVVRWQVADTGPGIAPDAMSKIFQHGFTTKKDGHGFGLHSCATAAAQMHGKMKVESDGLGKGATFTLEIPLLASNNQVANVDSMTSRPAIA